jgi:hypothetical protein
MTNAQATVEAPTPQAHWHEELNPPGTNGMYDAKYSFKNCIIWILKDHKGIIIVANTPGSTPMFSVGQTVTITMTSSGGVQTNKSPVWKTAGMAEGTTESHHDIFARYYTESARNLPPKIQALFYGEYGIGIKP